MLRQRIITALIIAPIAIAGVFFLPEPGFELFVAAVLTVAAWEWAGLAGLDFGFRFVYGLAVAVLMAAVWMLPVALPLILTGLVWWAIAFYLVVRYPGLKQYWSGVAVRSMIGALMIAAAWLAMLELNQFADRDFLILLLFLLIWGADIGAYFSGRALGKRKLAPDVSPGKSWAGFYGGMLTSLCIAVVMLVVAGQPEILSVQALLLVTGCVLVAMISVLGDLTISMFKRHAGVKDSSNLLPGHGGFLDRLDSLLSAAPLFAVLILTVGWN